MIEATLGSPTEPGIYAARQWYAWRILEWHEGAWWHVGRSAKWPVGNPPSSESAIEAFIGPLPVISKDYTKPPRASRSWNEVIQQEIVGTASKPEYEIWEEEFLPALDSTDSTPPVQEFDL